MVLTFQMHPALSVSQFKCHVADCVVADWISRAKCFVGSLNHASLAFCSSTDSTMYSRPVSLVLCVIHRKCVNLFVIFVVLTDQGIVHKICFISMMHSAVADDVNTGGCTVCKGASRGPAAAAGGVLPAGVQPGALLQVGGRAEGGLCQR